MPVALVNACAACAITIPCGSASFHILQYTSFALLALFSQPSINKAALIQHDNTTAVSNDFFIFPPDSVCCALSRCAHAR